MHPTEREQTAMDEGPKKIASSPAADIEKDDRRRVGLLIPESLFLSPTHHQQILERPTA